MIKKIILENLKKAHKGDDEYFPKGVSASEIFKCPRHLFYRILKKKPEPHAKNYFPLEQGIAHHKMLQKFLDVNKKTEAKVVDTKYILTCRPDAVQYIDSKKIEILGEFKEGSWLKWNSLNSVKDLIRLYESYYWQWQTMSFMLGIKAGSVIFYNSDNRLSDEERLKEIPMKQDSDAVKKIKAKCEMIKYAVEYNVLPPADPRKCKFCNYKKRCLKDSKAKGGK